MKSINEKQKHIYSKANQPNKNQKPKQTKNQTSIEIYQKVRLVIRQLNFSTSNIGKRYLQNESKTLIL